MEPENDQFWTTKHLPSSQFFANNFQLTNKNGCHCETFLVLKNHLQDVLLSKSSLVFFFRKNLGENLPRLPWWCYGATEKPHPQPAGLMESAGLMGRSCAQRAAWHVAISRIHWTIVLFTSMKTIKINRSWIGKYTSSSHGWYGEKSLPFFLTM